MYLKSLKNSSDGANFYKVVGKEPAALLKYEFFSSYLSNFYSNYFQSTSKVLWTLPNLLNLKEFSWSQ